VSDEVSKSLGGAKFVREGGAKGQFDVTLNGEVIFSMIRTEKNVTAEQVSKRLLEILNQKKYTSMEQPPSSGNAGPSDTSQQARSEATSTSRRSSDEEERIMIPSAMDGGAGGFILGSR
jgi:hypothetical protein